MKIPTIIQRKVFKHPYKLGDTILYMLPFGFNITITTHYKKGFLPYKETSIPCRIMLIRRNTWVKAFTIKRLS